MPNRQDEISNTLNTAIFQAVKYRSAHSSAKAEMIINRASPNFHDLEIKRERRFQYEEASIERFKETFSQVFRLPDKSNPYTCNSLLDLTQKLVGAYTFAYQVYIFDHANLNKEQQEGLESTLKKFPKLTPEDVDRAAKRFSNMLNMKFYQKKGHGGLISRYKNIQDVNNLQSVEQVKALQQICLEIYEMSVAAGPFFHPHGVGVIRGKKPFSEYVCQEFQKWCDFADRDNEQFACNERNIFAALFKKRSEQEVDISRRERRDKVEAIVTDILQMISQSLDSEILERTSTTKSRKATSNVTEIQICRKDLQIIRMRFAGHYEKAEKVRNSVDEFIELQEQRNYLYQCFNPVNHRCRVKSRSSTAKKAVAILGANKIYDLFSAKISPTTGKILDSLGVELVFNLESTALAIGAFELFQGILDKGCLKRGPLKRVVHLYDSRKNDYHLSNSSKRQSGFRDVRKNLEINGISTEFRVTTLEDYNNANNPEHPAYHGTYKIIQESRLVHARSRYTSMADGYRIIRTLIDPEFDPNDEIIKKNKRIVLKIID